MNETRSTNAGFIDSTRAGTLIGDELKAKEQRKRDKERQEDSTDPKSTPTQFNDVYEGDWFVDAEDDEELADTCSKNMGSVRPKPFSSHNGTPPSRNLTQTRLYLVFVS